MKTSCFIEVPTRLVHWDDRIPDLDERNIYEHLKYFCSKIFPLPAIDVRMFDGTLVVTRGHKYLHASLELGYPSVRAVLYYDGAEAKADLLRLLPGSHLISREVLEREANIVVARDFHVYFFDGPLEAREQDIFRTEIAEFFERLVSLDVPEVGNRVSGVSFPFGAECGEFQALIPVSDPSWCQSYLETCQKFSREVRRIVSFQGARFPTN